MEPLVLTLGNVAVGVGPAPDGKVLTFAAANGSVMFVVPVPQDVADRLADDLRRTNLTVARMIPTSIH